MSEENFGTLLPYTGIGRSERDYQNGYDDGLQEGEARGWKAGKKAVLEWLRNEDIEHDPDDLYTGRVHRVAAVEKLRKP